MNKSPMMNNLKKLGQLMIAGSFAAASATVLADDSVWEVGTFTDQIARASIGDGYDSADFYYPIVDEAERAAHENAFPLVVMLQGGLVDKSLYSNFANLLASQGYVVVIPNHYSRFSPFTPPMLYTSEWTTNDVWIDANGRDNNPYSPLHQIVDTSNMGVSGHSFGGAAALFTAASTCQAPFCFGPYYFMPPVVKAAVAFGTHTVPVGGPPGVPQNPLDVNNIVPVVTIQGSLDSMAEVEMTWPLLESTKGLIVLDGVNHWGVANIQNPPSNTPDPDVQTRSQSWSNEKSAKWAGVVYDAYLKGDAGALNKLRSQKAEKGVTVRFEE